MRKIANKAQLALVEYVHSALRTCAPVVAPPSWCRPDIFSAVPVRAVPVNQRAVASHASQMNLVETDVFHAGHDLRHRKHVTLDGQ